MTTSVLAIIANRTTKFRQKKFTLCIQYTRALLLDGLHYTELNCITLKYIFLLSIWMQAGLLCTFKALYTLLIYSQTKNKKFIEELIMPTFSLNASFYTVTLERATK